MKIQPFAVAVLVLALSACSAGYIPQPMDGWRRSTSTNSDITFVKRKCGLFQYNSEYPWHLPIANSLEARNRLAEIYQCIELHGFARTTKTNVAKSFKYCDQYDRHLLPACQTNAVIPMGTLEPEDVTQPVTKHDTPVQPFDPALNRQLQEQQFQQQVQHQSNSQINDLLKSTAPKK